MNLSKLAKIPGSEPPTLGDLGVWGFRVLGFRVLGFRVQGVWLRGSREQS